MQSSEDDWGFIPNSPLYLEDQVIIQKKMHRIASTSTIKSLDIESSSNSPAPSVIHKPELQVIAQARLQLISAPLNYNILVLGDSNIGKTSFIHSVLAKYFNEIAPELLGQKALFPTRNIIDNTGTISNRVIELRVNLIDTPGYGFFTTKEKWFETITNYITKQAYNYKLLNNRLSTATPQDIKVHLALYLIEGPRCKETDLEMMYRLQRYVNILPIVARADAYSSAELSQVKLQILSQCAEAGISFFDVTSAMKDNISQLNESLLPPIPPFAVISGGTIVKAGDKLSFVRKYSWGLCDIHDSACSDFNILCRLLFGHFVVPAIMASKALNKLNVKKAKRSEIKASSGRIKAKHIEKINWIAGVFSKIVLRLI